jgi:multicomponent Na+:H+ antiporter subunit B
MRKLTGLLLMGGFVLYLVSLVPGLFTECTPESLESVGNAIIADSKARSGSANVVTAIVVQYRGLDTLGEVTVLFVSALGVALLASGLHGNVFGAMFADDDGGFILQYGGRFLMPFIALTGVYIIAHGHLSPGGGFPGGVLIATAIFILILTGQTARMPHRLLSLLEGAAGLGFIGLGALGFLGAEPSFLANTMPKGEYLSLFSAGFIPFIYAMVGIKVASELTTVVAVLTEPSGSSGPSGHGTAKGKGHP